MTAASTAEPGHAPGAGATYQLADARSGRGRVPRLHEGGDAGRGWGAAGRPSHTPGQRLATGTSISPRKGAFTARRGLFKQRKGTQWKKDCHFLFFLREFFSGEQWNMRHLT